MYSEFGRALSLSMSTAQLFAAEKDSNPLQIDSPSNSKLEFTPTSQIPSVQVEKDDDRREGKMEAKGEESSPTLLPPSSSSSCSYEDQVEVKDERKKDPSGDSVEVGVLLEEEKETDQGKDNARDDDGYHTPTSPRHRIPEAGVCPPAPKKPVHLLYLKRKVRAGDQVRRRVDDRIEGEIGSFWGAELDDAGPRTKKARGEATNDH